MLCLWRYINELQWQHYNVIAIHSNLYSMACWLKEIKPHTKRGSSRVTWRHETLFERFFNRQFHHSGNLSFTCCKTRSSKNVPTERVDIENLVLFLTFAISVATIDGSLVTPLVTTTAAVVVGAGLRLANSVGSYISLFKINHQNVMNVNKINKVKIIIATPSSSPSPSSSSTDLRAAGRLAFWPE